MPQANARSRPQVVVADCGVDAAAQHHYGSTVLVLRPGQTFGSAVRAVSRCVPDLHPDEVRAIVRLHLPDAMDLDQFTADSLSTTELPAAQPSRHETSQPQRRPTRRRIPLLLPGIGVVLLMAAGIGIAGGDHVLNALTSVTEAASTVSGGDSVGGSGHVYWPHSEPPFDIAAEAVLITCEPVERMRATCTDSDGTVSVGEALVSPQSAHFTFTYGDERVELRVFEDARSARSWANQAATREAHPNLKRTGRFVVWGTDPEKVALYLATLTADTAASPKPSASAPQQPEAHPSATPKVTTAPTDGATSPPPQTESPQPDATATSVTTAPTSDTDDGTGDVTDIDGFDGVSDGAAVMLIGALGVPLEAAEDVLTDPDPEAAVKMVGDPELALGMGLITGRADLVAAANAALERQEEKERGEDRHDPAAEPTDPAAPEVSTPTPTVSDGDSVEPTQPPPAPLDEGGGDSPSSTEPKSISSPDPKLDSDLVDEGTVLEPTGEPKSAPPESTVSDPDEEVSLVDGTSGTADAEG